MRPMTVVLSIVGAFVCAAVVPLAQSKPPLAFEVASVHLSETPTFLPDRMSDRRIDLTRPLQWILRMAFQVRDYQLSAPVELNQVYVDLHATMPAGATVAQVPEMLRTLLVERFGLVTHRESRPMDTYELVPGPDGMKMREVKPFDDLKREFPADPSRATTDTTAETPTGAVRTISIPRGLRRITSRTMYERMTTPSGGLIVNATRMSMTELVSVLQGNVETALPIVDKTGLTGVYQFTVELPNDASLALLSAAAREFEISKRGESPGGSAAAFDRPTGIPAKALGGLGLKLEKRRVPVEMIVVDKIARTPTEN